MWFYFKTGSDLDMGYLSMSLDEPSKVILALIMPFGLLNVKYRLKEFSQPWISFKAG